MFCMKVMKGKKPRCWIVSKDSNEEHYIHVLKSNTVDKHWECLTVDWVWFGEKCSLNIVMVNTCPGPISFRNGFQRDSQNAQSEHGAWLFSFSFIKKKKKSSSIISHKIGHGFYVRLSTGLSFLSFCK